MLHTNREEIFQNVDMTLTYTGYKKTLFSDFSDKYSRKIFFACAVIVSAVAYTILLFTHDTFSLVMALLFMGFATPLRINTGLIYFMEMMPAHA